jgi:Spy/CpxP family protein refolding chaperone
MPRLAHAAAAAALVIAACSDSGTNPAPADEDDYALVMFGAPGSALENTLGPQHGRPFDGRTGFRRLPDELALTDEQKEAIAALRAEFAETHADELEALRAVFEEAREAREDGATREEVRAILEEGRPIGEALREDVRELHEAIFAVLTDEQREWLEAHRPPHPRQLGPRRGPPR